VGDAAAGAAEAGLDVSGARKDAFSERLKCVGIDHKQYLRDHSHRRPRGWLAGRGKIDAKSSSKGASNRAIPMTGLDWFKG